MPMISNQSSISSDNIWCRDSLILMRVCSTTNNYTHCAWAGETFFQLCCCVSFWFWREICFGFTYTTNYVLRVQYSCGVVLVFWFWRGIFLVLRMYLVYNTVVRLCSFLVVAGNSSQNENTFLQKNLRLLYYDPLVSQKYWDLSV